MEAVLPNQSRAAPAVCLERRMSVQDKLTAAVQDENWGLAESLVREELQRTGDPRSLITLANTLEQRNRLEAAEALLLSAVGDAPPPDALHGLAALQYRRQKFEACERTLEQLIAMAPAGAPLSAYEMLAKLRVARGRHQEARAAMALGVLNHPDQIEFVAAYAALLPPEQAIVELENHARAISGQPGKVAYLTLRITKYRAPLQRRVQGLPHYGTSWRDTYQWPDAPGLLQLKGALDTEIAAGSRRVSACMERACIALAEGAWEEAEAIFSHVRSGPKRTQADFIAFGARFHQELDALSDDDILKDLPPVARIRSPALQAGETIFIASDPTYFTNFTLPFLRQVEAQEVPLDVQVHLLDGAAAEWDQVDQAVGALKTVRVTLTAEASGARQKGPRYARNYFHAVRYIRLFETLKRSNRRTWIFDADVQLLRDPTAMLAKLADCDVTLRTSPSSFEPTVKVTASCVGLSPTPLGLAFARRVAAYISYWKSRDTWAWGVDQAALFSSYAYMAAHEQTPRTVFLDDQAMNDKTGDTGAIKFLSGLDKYFA